MTNFSDLTTYHDLKKIVDRESFTRAMIYVSWHNRLPMTHLLELWQAVVIAMLLRKQEVSAERYHDIKDYLLFDGHKTPQTIEDCEAMALQLEKVLRSDQKK
jgi:hypothetical protein